MHIMESPVEGVKRAFAGLELDTDKVMLHSANKQKIMLPYLGELSDDLKDGGDAFITVVITNSLYARVALVITSGRKKRNFPVEATTQEIEHILLGLLFYQKQDEKTRFYTNWGCGLSKHALGFYQGCFSYWQRGEEVPGLIVHERTLPDVDQTLALGMVKKQILAWDPDFTKATPEEHEAMEQAIKELDAGEYVTDDQINWD